MKKRTIIKGIFVLLQRENNGIKMVNSTNGSVLMGIDPGTNLLGYGIIAVQGKTVSILAMGVIDLRKCKDVYLKLGRIYERVSSLIASFHPTEMAIESPFFGKNVQSMLKLGRAQGVCIAAAVTSGVQVYEYAPTKIKLSLTGNGIASKKQVECMLQKIFHLNSDDEIPFLDATDAVAAAYCHYMQRQHLQKSSPYCTWSDFAKKNSVRIHPSTTKQK